MKKQLFKIGLMFALLAVIALGGGCASAGARVAHHYTHTVTGHSAKLPPYPGLLTGMMAGLTNPALLPLVALDFPLSAAADTILLPHDLYQLTQ